MNPKYFLKTKTIDVYLEIQTCCLFDGLYTNPFLACVLLMNLVDLTLNIYLCYESPLAKNGSNVDDLIAQMTFLQTCDDYALFGGDSLTFYQNFDVYWLILTFYVMIFLLSFLITRFEILLALPQVFFCHLLGRIRGWYCAERFLINRFINLESKTF